MDLSFQLTDKLAKPPRAIDVGVDLFSSCNVIFEPGEQKKINTHVVFQLPENTIGILKDKSSVVTQKGLKVDAGVIDTGYRGNVIVVLRNIGKKSSFINRGDPIAQMILVNAHKVILKQKDEIDTNTVRGTRGFGEMTMAHKDYCCPRQCFETPEEQVDGIACDKCESFSYCKCKCKSYLEKSRKYCCKLRCFKIPSEEVDRCVICENPSFCNCFCVTSEKDIFKKEMCDEIDGFVRKISNMIKHSEG